MLMEGSSAAQLDHTPVVVTFINSLKTMMDTHALRSAQRWNRIPDTIFVSLALLSALAIFLVGYIRGG